MVYLGKIEKITARAFALILAIALIVTPLFSAAKEYSSKFEAEKEFPNYFAQGSTEEQTVIRHELENILLIRFQNMTIPVPDEKGSYQRVRFFDWIGQQAKALGFADRAKFYPSAGLIRNGVSAVYEQMHIELQKFPDKKPLEILHEIKSKIPNEIFHSEIRGVGSDLDVVVDGLTSTELEKFNQTAKEPITAFERKSGLINTHGTGGSELKKSFLVIPDFKNVTTQLIRASGQGGLESDFLYFDMSSTAGKSRFRGPADLDAQAIKENPYLSNYKDAVERLYRGRPRYHVTYDPALSAVGATDAQVARALRTLGEAPWMHIDDTESAFRLELDRAVKSGELSTKAQDQFKKMVRNSRFGGGANRFYRASIDVDPVEQSIRELRNKFPTQFRRFLAQSTEAEMSERYKSATANATELKKALDFAILKPNELPAQLYHGTRSVETLQAVGRNGLVLSNSIEKDGTGAVYGDGAYASADIKTAQSYAGREGIVMPVHLKKDARVLDWGSLPYETREMIEAQAQKSGLSLNLYLHDKLGIGAVRNEHFMLLDMGAIENPVKKYSDILKFQISSLQRIPAAERNFIDVTNALQIAQYAELSGEPGIREILHQSSNHAEGINWHRLVTESFGRDPLADLEQIGKIDRGAMDPNTVAEIKKTILSSDFKTKLANQIWTEPKYLTLKIAMPLLGGAARGKVDPLYGPTIGAFRTVFADEGRLRREVLKKPITFAELMTQATVPDDIRNAIHETLLKLSSNSATRATLQKRIESELKSRSSWTRIEVLAKIPSEISAEIIAKNKSVTDGFETMAQYFLFTDDGGLSPVGEWVLRNNPNVVSDRVKQFPIVSLHIKADAVDKISAAGVDVAKLLENNIYLTDEGSLNGWGLWLKSNRPDLLLAKANAGELRLADPADLRWLKAAGASAEVIKSSSRSYVEAVINGRLTALTKELLTDNPAKLADFSIGSINAITELSDIEWLLDRGYPKKNIAWFANKKILSEIEARKKSRPRSAIAELWAEFKQSIRERLSFQKTFGAELRAAQKTPDSEAKFKRRLTNQLAKKDPRGIALAEKLSTELGSQDKNVRTFVRALADGDARVKQLILEAAIKRDDSELIRALPLDPLSVEERKVLDQFIYLQAHNGEGLTGERLDLWTQLRKSRPFTTAEVTPSTQFCIDSFRRFGKKKK